MSDDESEVEVKKFHIKAKAILLTYQKINIREDIENLKVFHNVVRWSWCEEKGTHTHTYLEFFKQVDHDSDNWFVHKNGDVIKCDVRANTATGTGFRAACDRGHFYVACAYKEDKGEVFTNYQPGLDYLVRTNWCHQLWQKGKIADDQIEDCAAFYKCLTKSFQDAIRVINKWHREQAVDRLRVKRRKWVADQLKPVVPPDDQQYKDWLAQYDERKVRYKFLWLWSPEGGKFGKSKFIQKSFKTFTHDTKINWTGYDPEVHDCILFDDIPQMGDYVYANKVLFQGLADEFTINASATNCHAERLYCAEKKIVICANWKYNPITSKGERSWIEQCCYNVQVEHNLF